MLANIHFLHQRSQTTDRTFIKILTSQPWAEVSFSLQIRGAVNPE